MRFIVLACMILGMTPLNVLAQETKPLPKPKIPSPASVNPTPFTGLSGEELIARLGKPQFSRVENGGSVWRFDRRNCVLHVFLLPGAKPSTQKVVHVEAFSSISRPAGPEVSDAEREQCFALFARESNP